MRDLSLHILDLIENSTRAGATVISVTIAQDPQANSFNISVEDNGPGLPTGPEKALDPFFTTKTGKETGLGLSLFRATAERAGGALKIERSSLGGVAVRASMQLDHLDRPPLGDLAETLASSLYTDPNLDIRCTVQTPENTREIRTSSLRAADPDAAQNPIAVARKMADAVSRVARVLHQ